MREIKLDDLSPKELEKLMEQARQKLEEERIAANARVEFKQKRANLLQASMDEIYACATFSESSRKVFYKNFIGLVNFLYKGRIWGFKCMSKTSEITDKKQWLEYDRIVKLVTECVKEIVKEG